MDRAHRLGQRRTVNVYRVLTRGTLEERIMGTQRFKLDTVCPGGTSGFKGFMMGTSVVTWTRCGIMHSARGNY